MFALGHSMKAPPIDSNRLTNSQGIPPMTSSFLSANTLIGATYPIVAIPPKKPYRSTIAVFAPCRAAAIAAMNPAGPPPAITTSYRPASGASFRIFRLPASDSSHESSAGDTANAANPAAAFFRKSFLDIFFIRCLGDF